jgi:3-oxoacyl-ACP reductase-like protein
VRADTVKFLGSPQKREDQESAPHSAPRAAAPAATAPAPAAASAPFSDEGGDLAQDEEHLPF